MKKKNSEIMYELALKLSDNDMLIEHSLSEGTMIGAITEAGDGAIDEPDVEKLRKAVNNTLKAVDANIKAASGSNLTSLVSYFSSIKSSLGKASELVTKFDLSDSEGMGAKLKGFFGKKIDIPRAMQAVIQLQN